MCKKWNERDGYKKNDEKTKELRLGEEFFGVKFRDNEWGGIDP